MNTFFNDNVFKEKNFLDFSIVRIAFYGSILVYYRFMLDVSQWAKMDRDLYWSPISFFKFIDPETLFFPNYYSIRKLFFLSALCCCLGFFYKVNKYIAAITFLILIGIPLNFGKVHHSGHMPVVIMLIFAFAPYAGRLSIDYLALGKIKFFNSPEWSFHYRWPLHAAQFYICLVYLAAGLQKLRTSGLEWIFSDNLQTILLTRPTVTSYGLWVAQYPILCQLIAGATILIQLSCSLALVKKRFIILPLMMASFHYASEALMGAHAMFRPYIICGLVWIPYQLILAHFSPLMPERYCAEWS